MRISDWSADVCSSDLACRRCRPLPDRARLLKRVSCSARKLAPEFQGAPDDKPRPPAPRDRSAQARSTATRSLSHRPPPRMHMSASSEASVTPPADRKRSEEHTSELQSLMRNSYAVFCLKKKTKKQKQIS